MQCDCRKLFVAGTYEMERDYEQIKKNIIVVTR